MIRYMVLRDKELISRFVRDDENPDYIFASDKCLIVRKDCERFRDYLRRRKDAVFIFLNLECIEPDMNLFDYAFTWNPDLICGDRIIHNIPAAHSMLFSMNGREVAFHTNGITREGAQKILDANPSFCNFIYSHPNEPRDSFFHLLSQYKNVASSGRHLNNTGTKSTRDDSDWYDLSVKMKEGYKFSIAMENASSKGYTTEKIISSLQAHTVPIYWGDPAVADFINPKAFINCNDYSSFDEVVERVKEIDNNDELWLDMVTQPWQTEEQKNKVLRMLDENDALIRNIFAQDIKKARRRAIGIWHDYCRKGFTGVIGMLPPLHIRAIRRIRRMIGTFIPPEMKPAIKRFLRMD